MYMYNFDLTSCAMNKTATNINITNYLVCDGRQCKLGRDALRDISITILLIRFLYPLLLIGKIKISKSYS